MSIKVSQTFERTSAQPIDASLTLTKAQMVAVNDNLMPAYYFTICQDDGKLYLYDKSATASATTGKFTEFSGGGSSDVKFFTTTDTLNKEINGTKVVAAADLPGVTWSDLVVGSSVIKDAKGTMGLVTAINGTTDVTVTTATTSTPTVELTQAEYDALATKDPDTIYFITDNYVGSTYVGAYDTIYSTTERVVGSYMGKPLYQRTIEEDTTLDSDSWVSSVDVSSFNIDNIINAVGHSNALKGSLSIDTKIMSNTLYIFTSDLGGTVVNRLTLQYTKTTDSASPVGYASPNDYSTSEKIVGNWINGKPVYQKVYSIYMTSDSYTTPFLPEVDDIISINFMSKDSRNSYSHPYYSGTNDYSRVYVENGNLLVKLGSAYPTKPATVNIIIQYTKTTD